MDREALEDMVEEIMRYYYMGDYEKYSSEELREKYRKELLEKENENASC